MSEDPILPDPPTGPFGRPGRSPDDPTSGGIPAHAIPIGAPRGPAGPGRKRRVPLPKPARLSTLQLLLNAATVAVAVVAAVLVSKWWLLLVLMVPLSIGAEWYEVRQRAGLAEPGDYRVVLQVAGRRPVQVIKVIRDITRIGLKPAKELVDSAPAVIVERLSEQSAVLAVERLQRAGARAVATPMDEEGGSFPGMPPDPFGPGDRL